MIITLRVKKEKKYLKPEHLFQCVEQSSCIGFNNNRGFFSPKGTKRNGLNLRVAITRVAVIEGINLLS